MNDPRGGLHRLPEREASAAPVTAGRCEGPRQPPRVWLPRLRVGAR
jgi:hypothetical protein